MSDAFDQSINISMMYVEIQFKKSWKVLINCYFMKNKKILKTFQNSFPKFQLKTFGF